VREEVEVLGSLPVRLANVFMVAYALDAALSLVVLGLQPELFLPWLAVLQRLLALFVHMMVFGCLFMIAVSARLPMLLLLGLCLSVFWLASGGAPFPLVIPPDAGLSVALAGIQLVFAVLVALRVRRLNRGSGWLLRDDTLETAAVGLMRPVRFVATLVVLVVPLAAVYLFVSLATWLQVETERFVSLDLSGIELADRRYVHAGRELRLVGMMHLGEDETYHAITETFDTEDTIVLEEGVSDADEMLTGTLSYARLAEALGLNAQQPIASYFSSQGGASVTPQWPVIRNADVDARLFAPTTREVLAHAAQVWGADQPAAGFWMLYTHLLENPEVADQFFYDIVEMRNHHLLSEIKEAFGHYPRVIVPWGALHLPQIERRMLEDGFVLQQETRRRILAWKTLWAAIF